MATATSNSIQVKAFHLNADSGLRGNPLATVLAYHISLYRPIGMLTKTRARGLRRHKDRVAGGGPVDCPSEPKAAAAAGSAVSLTRITPVKAAQTPDMVLTVLDRLTEHIVQGDFDKHGLLPPEGDLAESFGASRTVIRERNI
jgi:hypothetical protein